MDYIRGFTFLLEGNIRGHAGKRIQRDMERMKEDLSSDTVVLAFQALQENAHSEEIDFTGNRTPDDEELCALIEHAKDIGLRVSSLQNADARAERVLQSFQMIGQGKVH